MTIDIIERVELEITNDCNAACPGCARTQNLDLIEHKNLTLKQIQDWFPDRRHIENKSFKLCGVLGDPIVNPECMDITKYLLKNGGKVQYSTNGGRNSASWWYELGKLSATYGENKLKVHFCVDGHKETNHIYRVNTKYDIIDRNMQAYSDGGKNAGTFANASWIYIVFDHNEHELEIAKNRAKELNFSFATRTGMRNSYHNWVSKIKKKDLKANKLVTEEKVITTKLKNAHSKIKEVQELDRFIKNDKKDEKQINEIVTSISCKFYHDKEIFIAANGTLWPCCFLWDSVFKKKDNILEKYESFPLDWNNLNKNSIDNILNTQYYKKTLEESFDPRHNLHINRCVRTCAKNRAYHNEIKYQDV